MKEMFRRGSWPWAIAVVVASLAAVRAYCAVVYFVCTAMGVA